MRQEPQSAALMLAFDNLTIAIQAVECATAATISDRVARLQEQRKSFRSLFNNFFVRNQT
jgi:hypothetical protein